MRFRKLLPLLLLSALAFAESHPVALKAARLFDGTANQTVSQGLVVVENGKITQVGGTAPAGA